MKSINVHGGLLLQFDYITGVPVNKQVEDMVDIINATLARDQNFNGAQLITIHEEMDVEVTNDSED